MLADAAHFPTDSYLADSVARLLGLRVVCRAPAAELTAALMRHSSNVAVLFYVHAARRCSDRGRRRTAGEARRRGGEPTRPLVKAADPRRDVHVWERQGKAESDGFGVILSGGALLDGLSRADAALATQLRWLGVGFDRVTLSHGGAIAGLLAQPFTELPRRAVLERFDLRCQEAGINVRYHTDAPPLAALRHKYDLVVAADGANSRIRAQLPAELGVQAELVESTLAGSLRARTSKGSPSSYATGPAERLWRTPTRTARAAHSWSRRQPQFLEPTSWSGSSPTCCGGGPLRQDRPSWRQFIQVRCERWSHGRVRCERWTHGQVRCERWTHGQVRCERWKHGQVRCERWTHGQIVLLGDAAHTTHYSIGSGTKLALEDALVLADALDANDDPRTAAAENAARRMPVVVRAQEVADVSRRSFASVGDRHDAPAPRLLQQLITRGGGLRIGDIEVADGLPAAPSTVIGGVKL